MRRFIICLFGFLLPVLATPAIYDGGVVNGADFTLNFSPGMLISVFGANLATATKLASVFPLPTAIDGVSVEVVDGTRTLNAPLFFVSAGQINAQLPFDITSASVQVRVKNATGTSATQTIAIVARCPRILTKTMNGLGDAILTHADFTVVSEQLPAKAGEWVVLYLAGLGAVSPSIAAGQAAGTGTATNPLNVVQDEVVVKVEGVATKIYYKGLAPYFAGLYQINFQVPETAQQAISDLTVEVGKQVSQGRVRFAVARGTTSLTSGTIPSGGGTVAAGGFSMSVPVGAFSAATNISIVQASAGLPVDAGRASEVYGISGLPSTTAAPITLAVSITGAIPAGLKGYLAVQMPGFDGGIMYLAGTVEGNRLVATLPANAGKSVTGAVQRRVDFEDPDVQMYWVWMTMLGDAYFSENGRFKINLMPGGYLISDEGSAKLFVDEVLNPAVEKLLELGFRWPASKEYPNTPRRVQISFAPLSGAEKLFWCGGDVFYGATDKEVRIRLNSRLIEGVNKEALDQKAVHVLLHYLRAPDGPPAATYPWLWMDEAVATWLERQQAWLRAPKEYIPLQEKDFWNFAWRGLEVAATTEDREELMLHGWGASRFMEELILVKGVDLLKEIYQVHYTPSQSALKPVEVLRSDLLPTKKVDISDEWERFVYRLGPDTFLLPDRTNLTDAVGSRNGTLLGKANETVVFKWNAPHLSAQFFQVNMPAQWSAGSVLSAAATGDSDITVYYYRVPASGSPEVLPEKNGFERKTPATAFKSGDRLWIVAVNKKAVSPFDSRTPVSITIRVQTPQPSFLTSLRTMTLVTASIDATPVCTISKDFQSAGLCPRALLLANDRVSVAGRVPFNPVSWDREFTASDTGTLAGVSTNYTMSFKLSETGDAVQSAQVESTATWRQTIGTKTYSMERKMGFSVEDIPHVYPFELSNSTLLHSFEVVPLAGAAPKNLVSWSYTITADGTIVGTVTGLDWTKSMLKTGTPTIAIRFDK